MNLPQISKHDTLEIRNKLTIHLVLLFWLVKGLVTQQYFVAKASIIENFS